MRKELTELEQCVVGVVWRDGPMTAYEIALMFSTSLSSYWSGSAGAIYPLVERLRKRGLLQASKGTKGRTRRTLFTTTPRGVEALRSWISPPLPPIAGAPSFDPIRTRLFFIEVLPKSQRAAFLDEAEQVIRGQLAAVKERRLLNIGSGQFTESLGDLGATYELQARLRWLRDVRKLLA